MTSGATLTAVVCEDDAVVAAALVDTVDGMFGFEVVARVDSGDDALAAVARVKPDIVVLDLAVAGDSGLRIVADLRRAAAACAVVVVVPYRFGGLRASAEEAGAMALMELTDLRPLRACLERIHISAHAESCPSCPALRPPSTAPSTDPARSRVTIHSRDVTRPGFGPTTGGPSSSTGRS